MVIHSINMCSVSGNRLVEILNMHTNDENLIHEAIKILKDNGSIEYAKHRAADLLEEAWNELDQILPKSTPKTHLENLSKYLIDREL
jgi:geranylgeranyl pyrophosphate synthase